jgi:hypothetical protein
MTLELRPLMNTPDHHWVIQQRKPVTRGSLETGAPLLLSDVIS